MEDEIRDLKNRLARKDGELVDHQLEVARHRAIRRESAKVAQDLNVARGLLQKEQEHVCGLQKQVHELEHQLEEMERRSEEVKLEQSDLNGLRSQLQQSRDQESRMERDLVESQRMVRELRSELASSSSALARPRRELHMVACSREPGDVVRFREQLGKKEVKKEEIFSSHSENWAKVGPMLLSCGMVDGPATLAKVLLSRIGGSVYGPEARQHQMLMQLRRQMQQQGGYPP